MVAAKRTVIFASLTLILALALVSPVQAESKAWAKGDQWAVGVEEDFSELFDEITEELRKEADNHSAFVDYDYDNEGKIGIYYHSEVADDTGDQLEVNSEVGFYIHAYTDNTLKFTAVPVEGNHTQVTEGEDEDGNPTWKGVQTKARTLTVKAGVDFVVKISTNEFYNPDDMTLEDLKVTFTVGASFEFRGSNIPEFKHSEDSTYNEADDTETYDWFDIKFHDLSWGGEVEVDFVVDLEFSPGLDLYNLPITAGEVWGGKTSINASGDFGGVIKLDKPKGVPEKFFDEFYEGINSGFEEANITKTVSKWADLFPLNVPNDWLPFDDLNDKADDDADVDLNLRVDGNRFKWGPISSPEPVWYNFTTGDQRNITLPNGTTIEAFEIIGVEEDDQGGRGNDNFYDQVSQGEEMTHSFYVDDDLDELDLTWDLTDDNGTVDSNVTLQIKDDQDYVVWEKMNVGSEYSWDTLYEYDLSGSGTYTLVVIGNQGDMTYDIDVESDYYESEGDGPELPEIDFKPFFSAEDGQVATVEMESEALEEVGLDMKAAPVEPSEAKQAINEKADAEKPAVGGVNEGRTWTEPGGGDDDDDDSPSVGLGLVLGLIGTLALATRRNRH